MGVFDIIRNAISSVVDPILLGDATVYRKAKVPNGRLGHTYVATPHAARALVIDYTDFKRSADGIPAQNRNLILSVASLAITLKTDDVIGFPDGTFWAPVGSAIEPSNGIISIQVSRSTAPNVGAVGAGTITIGAFTFAGSALSGAVGSGAFIMPEFNFLGAGEVEVVESLTAEGSFAVPEFTFDGDAVATNVGLGSIDIPAFTFTGGSATDHEGAGAFIIPEFTFYGSGVATNKGIGDITIPAFTFTGGANADHEGIGAFTVPEFTFDGDAVAKATASGAITISEFTFLGEGEIEEESVPEAVSGEYDVTAGSWVTNVVSVPAGTVNGDLLIGWTHTDGFTADTPAGWTAGPSGEYFNRIHWFWRVANSEPSTYNFSVGSGSFALSGIIRVTGANTTDPFEDDFTIESGNVGGNRFNTGITTTSADTLLICYSDGTSVITSVPSGWATVTGAGTAGSNAIARTAGVSGDTPTIEIGQTTPGFYFTAMVGIKPA